MQPILVRMELGPVGGPMPNFAVVVDEFVRKAKDAGIGARPAMKVTDVLEWPEKWEVSAGTEGYVALLGTTTDRVDAVDVLSSITVSVPAVIGAKVLSPAEVDEFHEQARRIVERRKQQQNRSAGRHASAPRASSGAAPTSAGPDEHPFELALSTPEEVRKTPLDILSLVR
ncbi:hypothetical protein [Mycolicibacterium fortuitum]|uniref:hypothetical protein n=2 Tax=Mycobacteriaceae TaxID=1762 RepID=UPI0007E95714|nr:hypothetical protein [Mycolicibacterium fortuitum]OBF76120.1 hypothetical protein A5751_24610 [Mycolicibacterium fortuitum]